MQGNADSLRIGGVSPHSRERKDIERFLAGFQLKLGLDVEYIAVAKEQDKIIGTCSYAGDVIKCFAVLPDYQCEGVAAKLLTHLNDVLFAKGITGTYLFSLPENCRIFQGLGYRLVHSTPQVVLLEGQMANVQRYVLDMLQKSGLDQRPKAALVMNCNPFTLGHRYLIEKAARENEQVIVFLVETDRSLFPFSQRYELLKQGTKDLKNVKVIPGGRYIISLNTFPTYFLKEANEQAAAFVELDAGIFGRYIAPVFHITARYVGTEPYCRVTGCYNDALLRILPDYGVEVRVVERIKGGRDFISASAVRRLMREGCWDELRDYVSPATYEDLKATACRRLVASHKVLSDREKRYDKIVETGQKHHLPVICGKVNYPAPVKNTPDSDKVFQVLKKVLLIRFAYLVVSQHEIWGDDGQSILLAVSMNAAEAKEAAVDIEEKHPLGRLFDIDVYKEDGKPLSREALQKKPRKCFVCDEEARVCTRSLRHDPEEVMAKFAELLRAYREENDY